MRKGTRTRNRERNRCIANSRRRCTVHLDEGGRTFLDLQICNNWQWYISIKPIVITQPTIGMFLYTQQGVIDHFFAIGVIHLCPFSSATPYFWYISPNHNFCNCLCLNHRQGSEAQINPKYLNILSLE